MLHYTTQTTTTITFFYITHATNYIILHYTSTLYYHAARLHYLTLRYITQHLTTLR